MQIHDLHLNHFFAFIGFSLVQAGSGDTDGRHSTYTVGNKLLYVFVVLLLANQYCIWGAHSNFITNEVNYFCTFLYVVVLVC